MVYSAVEKLGGSLIATKPKVGKGRRNRVRTRDPIKKVKRAAKRAVGGTIRQQRKTNTALQLAESKRRGTLSRKKKPLLEGNAFVGRKY